MPSKESIKQFELDLHVSIEMLKDDDDLMLEENPTEDNLKMIKIHNTFAIFGMAYAKFAKPRKLKLFEDRNRPTNKSVRAVSFYGQPGSTLEIDFFEYGNRFLPPKSVLIFPNTYRCEIIKSSGVVFDQYFEYEDYEIVPEDGEKIFTVTATCTDMYEIQVAATDRDAAIAKAKDIHPHEWVHLDIFPEIKQSQILRVTKWAQFGIKE